MNRVVITGLGAVTPFGFGVDTFWTALLALKNGITKIKDIPVQGEIVSIAGSMPRRITSPWQMKCPELFTNVPEDDDVTIFFSAVVEALCQSDIDIKRMNTTDRIGLFIADRRMGFINYIDQYAPSLKKALNGTREFNRDQYYSFIESSRIGKRTPYNDPDTINHYTARAYGITGPQLSVATACASGNTSIGEAFTKIRNGHIDIAVTGGSYNYDMSSMIGFTRIEALTKNSDPETACRPFDADRNGFVMGSGCGILILESLPSATLRGSHILAEVTGYGYLSDAYRQTDPDPEAASSTQTIAMCLADAKVNPREVNYINAHGTSTKMNDLTETTAIKKVFGDNAYQIPVSSTKSMIGHSIMAAAALEGIVCVKSINENVVHGTRNFRTRDVALDLDYVPDGARAVTINHALSNSFGFGGQNTSILFSKY
jgi:3-oxoacyl-[acyl-carrier-protein] synthase II